MRATEPHHGVGREGESYEAAGHFQIGVKKRVGLIRRITQEPQQYAVSRNGGADESAPKRQQARRLASHDHSYPPEEQPNFRIATAVPLSRVVLVLDNLCFNSKIWGKSERGEGRK